MVTSVAIIVGAGRGLRFASDSQTQKQFLLLGGEPLILKTLQPFLTSNRISSCVLVVPKSAVDLVKKEVAPYASEDNIRVIAGGERRQDSVRFGVEAADGADVVVVHDAVRPFVRQEWISQVIDRCINNDGAIVALSVSDTLKKVVDGRISETIPRDNIWQAQTPQAFRRELLMEVYASVDWENVHVTDEAQLLEIAGKSVAIVPGSSENFKITTQDDWSKAEVIWEQRHGK
ncbi:MAG TPA: 2-C-methyl-D-erythritol 4-phosphate cytidylyltransferase [Candidatus Marinimicrobia bacterium]|nr:2-C-methyl-D-erythritol 4-phosphate cytidylyltransferase [Candidatus Neomarinimicrobiota bacterium]HIA86525.1 2-C-methyl-D-erythritol 4-phosphate cytidylyltransferase [Candidatus Neomarinimicrobiota bacterium]